MLAKEATLQVRMDSELKEQGMPFSMHLSPGGRKRTLGIANGKYKIPDDIDESNDEIAEIFGVK